MYHLSDADELTIVDAGLHDPSVQQPLHRGLDPERVSPTKKSGRFFDSTSFGRVDPHLTVDDDRPGVQFLAIVHHNGSSLLHHSENHH